MNKKLLVVLYFLVLAAIAVTFGAQAFVYSDEIKQANPPVYFKLNPVLWLPAWYLLHGEVNNANILSSLLYAIPYWLLISFIMSKISSAVLFKKNNAPRLKSGEGTGGEV